MKTIFFCIMTLILISSFAQEKGLEKSAELIRIRSEEGVRGKYPGLDLEAMRKFYEENAPDLLSEWRRRCKEQPEEAQSYLELLASHFREIDALRLTQPAEYERLVRQQKLESEIRALSRKIQTVAASKNPDQDALLQLKLRLRTLMEQNFDEAQARQQLEITRLENEIRALKNLAEDRAANKYLILSQRFWLLTGQPWPEKND